MNRFSSKEKIIVPMDIESLREFCLAKKGTTEETPFDNTTLVFKVMGKMYCLVSLEVPHSINVKCNPEWAEQLREQYEEIKTGYHMNKRHWNTVSLTGTIDEEMVKELIDHSYTLVVAKLRKKDREALSK